jgi:ABC-type multidrug transport system ATPase subunit
MWDLVEGAKAGRATVLTSHVLEEVEHLSDRAAIMVNGRLQAVGTPQHLKSRFGDGYVLEIACVPAAVGSGTPRAAIEAAVRELCPGAAAEEAFHSHHLALRLPAAEVRLSHLLRLLEARGPALGIADFVLTQGTLERVFLSFARQQAPEARR